MDIKIKRSDLNRIIKEEKSFLRPGQRMTAGMLKSALVQRGYLMENQIEDMFNAPDELGDSVDSQIDNYLSNYENAAKTTSENTMEAKNWRSTVRNFLTEAEEDEEGGEEETGESKDDAEPTEPPKLSLEDINVEEFSNSVARMVENYDSLLEIKNTLIRRSSNFLKKNYDENVVKTFETALREQHGLVVGKSKGEVADDEFKVPNAGEAGPLGGV